MALFVTFVASTSAAQVGGEITVVSWGGAYTQSQIDAYIRPFASASDIYPVIIDYGGGLAEIRAQLAAGNVTWDVVDVEEIDLIRGCDEGIFEPLDVQNLRPANDGTSAAQDFFPGLEMACGVPTIIWSTVVISDARAWSGDRPTTIADFFDTKRFPGKRGLRKNPRVALEWALLADGVPTDQIYQILGTREGADRAFAVLDRVKDDLIWWQAGAQPRQLIADGEVVMTSSYSGRAAGAIREGLDVDIIFDGQVWTADYWAIPKGSPNMKAALEFVRFASSTEALATQASIIGYGPTRRSSISYFEKTLAGSGVPLSLLPTASENFKTAIKEDTQFWADHNDDLNARFLAWLVR